MSYPNFKKPARRPVRGCGVIAVSSLAKLLLPFKPTLGQVFVLSLIGLTALQTLLFYLVFDASRATIIESSERFRERASREIGERVAGFLSVAPNAVLQFQQQVSRGLVDGADLESIERALLALLLSKPDLGELTLTFGTKIGFDENGAMILAKSPRGQLSAVRAQDASGSEGIWYRQVYQENGKFFADRRVVPPDKPFGPSPSRRDTGETVPDPTLHLTFITPAREDLYGQLLWSDLHWSQLDSGLPEAQRHAEVSVQKVINTANGRFLGVLRVGLRTRQLDRAVSIRLEPPGENDPHHIFLCDARGRLITRISPSDRLVPSGEDLRIESAALPPEVAHALSDTKLRDAVADARTVSGRFRDHGKEFLTTFSALPETQDWIVGIVVPRSHYLGKLTAMRNRLLAILVGVSVFLVVCGALILRAVKRAQSQIVAESLKMNAFEFSPAPTISAFRDVGEVLESLEKAKTAMRAMGKYVPIDLVRRLYREKNEPVLGGELMEISIMFTDIKGFTSFSERLAPDQLATALGRYLDVMTRVIQGETRGTIDKYVGDAIMTIWNAPEPVTGHAGMACLAALRCSDAASALNASSDWRGLPPFATRFGIHCETAMVGHFGSPDRMNYTAIGDAVNLASRLEGLNKQYGTTIIASETIFEAAQEAYEFRLLDRVAVKGKSEAITIYELIGLKDEKRKRKEAVENYEKAFAAYLARNFDQAIALARLSAEDDPPSAVLIERCRVFLREPPPPDWKGVHAAESK